MENFIKGSVKRIIFSSNDGFTVGLIKVKESNDQDVSETQIDKQMTFTGLFHELNIDENYTFYGEVIDNPKYGFQYKVNRYEKLIPEDKDGLILFLSSDIFPKIGEKTAESIVNYLGEDCLKKIVDDYNSLLIVPKMTEKRALTIHDKLVKYNSSFETVVYLTNFGFNMKDALKIYNHYLENTIKVVEENPYELIDTIDGITFSKIDELRSKTKVKLNDERRILALIIYVLKTLCFQNGDTYAEIDSLYNAVRSVYEEGLSEEQLEIYLIKLNQMGKIVIDGNRYMLYETFKNENYIANTVYYLSNKKDKEVKDIELKIEKLEGYFGITYNEEQERAVKQAIIKNFSIITGGPGTGKTTIIKGIVELYKMLSGYSYDKLEDKMVLLAPTGRAAKRMSESCNYPASTIHRYLKWNKETGEFGYNEQNKVSAEFIIIDETSMIDTDLLANLFKALPQDIKLVFIGDYNQLESVSPGKVLRDLIDSDIINTIFLKEIYRQDENSFITELAKEVNDGELQEAFLEKKDDYNFINCENDDVLKACCEVANKAINKGYDLKNVQILAPMYKGVSGIDNLNRMLQKIFNPKNDDKNETYTNDAIYREGDKILQLENMPDDNVFNGDIGFIKKIEGTEITIDFDGNMVKYKPKDYKSIKHGYAISIHKAQGSEFDIVIMPVTNAYRVMLYRKLVYTGITRAKRSLILIGDPKSFCMAVYNEGNKERKTNLKNLILKNIS